MDNRFGKIEIEAQSLAVGYGKQIAFRAESAQIQGRIIAVIGHNGSGKSTLIKSILRLLIPKEGHLRTTWLEDKNRTILIPEEHMAFSPENGAVFEDVSVEHYIRLWCAIKQGDSSYYKKAGSYYIDRLNVAPLLPKLGRELSKGQRRRVQSLVGFLTNPRLFLFDEPFDGLDILQSNELSNLMLDEGAQRSMIISSHRMEFVERLADMVVVLDNGRIFTFGTVDEVCRVLCGVSIAVRSHGTNTPSVIELLPALQNTFYSCLVHQMGNELFVTGSDVTTDALQRFFAAQQITDVTFSAVRPSLVDAMRYYFRKLH